MTITVGTDVYVSLADADTYWSNKNNSTWSAASDADKEKALRVATQFLDGAFTYIGVMTDFEQPLAWPRSNAVIHTGNYAGAVYDVDEIPQKLKDANCELALECLSGRILPAKERGGAIKREKVDVLEVEYSDFAPSKKTYDFVALILRGLTMATSNTAKLIRT